MKIYLPNSAHLQNFDGFIKKQDPADPSQLEFETKEGYVSVHPLALSMSAAAALEADRRGGTITAKYAASEASVRYLARMKLTDALGVDPALEMTEHAPEGRFIPITQVTDQRGLNDFIIDMVPLLHASPDEAGPIKYVITELVRNVLEHAASPIGAVVCAQYFGRTNRLSLGVADMGVGVRASIARFHAAPTDLDAIHMALRPGVTGTTARLGGNEQNAGAGLFFTKSIARVSRNFFLIYSGSAMFKLLKGPEAEQPVLLSDPTHDRATRLNALPAWPGTAIGIDVNVGAHDQFDALLSNIREAYHLETRAKKRKEKYRRPRFA